MSANTIENDTTTLPIPKVYIELLKKTEQNPRYHAEGNVLNHTLLVLSEFYEIAGLGILNEADREVLYWAALLHDIGKPTVTHWDGITWRAAGHERAGVPIARNILMQQDISPRQRQRILDLVKWHHLPLRLGLKNAPLSAYEHIAFQTDIRLLGLFSQMDLRGRICENASEIQDLIFHFNEILIPRIEDMWGSYEDIQARFQSRSPLTKNMIWFALQESRYEEIYSLLSREDAHPEPISTCYVSIGVPKSGKSDYIRRKHGVIPTFYEASHFSYEGELSNGLKQFLDQHLSRGETVVVDGCHLNVPKRQQIADYIRRYQTSLQYLYFQRSLSDVLMENSQSSFPINPAHIKCAYAQLICPHPWEAHGMEIV